MADDIRWIRSYEMEEESGTLGTVLHIRGYKLGRYSPAWRYSRATR